MEMKRFKSDEIWMNKIHIPAIFFASYVGKSPAKSMYLAINYSGEKFHEEENPFVILFFHGEMS